MPVIRLTDLSIRALKTGNYYDQNIRGFGIRIGKHRKTWHVVKDSSRAKITIGHYPAISLAEARRKALVALGTPYQPAVAPLFPEARSEYLAQDRWKPRSAKETTRLLTRHFNWQKTLDKITASDVAVAIDAIPAKSEAAHALKDIKTFFNWCVPRYLAHSPSTGLKPPSRYVPRERLLTTDELVAIWRTAEEMGQYGRQVQLLILTGQRCGQFLKPHSAHGGTLTFPPAAMKGNRAHAIPLGALAASLIGGTPVPFSGKRKAELDRLSGVTGWTHHDIRRAFASGMASLGVGLPVIERLLAHRSGSFAGIVGVYQHYSFANEMQEAIARWENHLSSICGIDTTIGVRS